MFTMRNIETIIFNLNYLSVTSVLQACFIKFGKLYDLLKLKTRVDLLIIIDGKLFLFSYVKHFLITIVVYEVFRLIIFAWKVV